MSDQNPSRLRFSIRWLLMLIAGVAVGMVFSRWYLEVRNSRPLEAAVEAYNTRHLLLYNEVVADGNPPLTIEQVIDYLQSDEEIITQAPAPVAAIFKRIVKTKRLPNSVDFDFVPLSGNSGLEAWLVGMEIMDKDARYRINIRKLKVKLKPPEKQVEEKK